MGDAAERARQGDEGEDVKRLHLERERETKQEEGARIDLLSEKVKPDCGTSAPSAACRKTLPRLCSLPSPSLLMLISGGARTHPL